jgi:hypothetical protein
MAPFSFRPAVLPATLVLALLAVGGLPAQPPPDGSWKANAVLHKPITRTAEGLGPATANNRRLLHVRPRQRPMVAPSPWAYKRT